MHPGFPIEQLVRLADTQFQLGFATRACNLLPDREEFLLSPSRKGLFVLGRNEDALQIPVDVLRDLYGARLKPQPPRVRLIEEALVREPIMHVRISAQTAYLEPIKKALAKRGAQACEEYVRSTYCVLRYEAPLACLLGLPAELAACTEGKARHWIVLSHYAPLKPDPGARAG